MFGVGLVELVVLAFVLVVVVVGLARLVGRLARGGGEVVAPDVESRRILLTRLAGLAVGSAAAWWTTEQGSLGTGVMLAPAVLGLCVVVAMAVGETVVRPPRDQGPRTASLRPRRVRDYAPPALLRAVGVQLLAVVALLVLTTATAGRDEYSGGLRVLSCTGPGYGSSTGPYPGAYYSLPLAAVLLVVLGVAALSARLVLRRPRGNGAQGADDALRRRSLRVVVAATGFALAAPYVGLAVTAGSALQRLGSGGQLDCAADWMRPAGVVVGFSGLAAGVLALGCLVVLLGVDAGTPARREAARR